MQYLPEAKVFAERQGVCYQLRSALIAANAAPGAVYWI